MRIDGPLTHRLVRWYTVRGFRGASTLWKHAERKTPLPANSLLHVGRYTVPLSPGTDQIDVHLYRGYYETPELTLVAQYIGRGATVVDVGANSGLYSVLALSLGASRVIAVEPNPQLARTLRRISGLDVREVAVSNASGKATLHVFRNTSYISSIRDHGVDESDPIEVDVTTLDDLLLDQPKIDFLKIDVEHLEADVLAGATGIFSRHRVRRALIEVLAEHRQVADYLAEWGYTSRVFGTNSGKLRCTPATFPIPVSSGQPGNYLVTPLEPRLTDASN